MKWDDPDQPQTWCWQIQPSGQWVLWHPPACFYEHYSEDISCQKNKNKNNRSSFSSERKKELILSLTLRNLAWKSSSSPLLITDTAQLLDHCLDFWLLGRVEPMFLEVNHSNKLMWNSFVGLHFLMLHKKRLWIVLDSGKNHVECFLRFQSQWRI